MKRMSRPKRAAVKDIDIENRRMVNEAKQEHEANGESSENFRFLVVGRGLKKFKCT